MGATEDQLRRDAETQRSQMGETLEAIGDRLSPERMVERRKAAVGQALRKAKHTVMGSPDYEEPAAQRLRAQAGDAVHTATGAVQQAPQALADQTRGNPIAAGIIAFGTGLLLATVLPRSRAEQRLVEEVKPQLQQAADELKDAGREVASGAKEHAREAVEEVKSAGSAATANVREQAEQSAESVKSARP